MNTDNHSTKQSLGSQSERSPMDIQSKSTTPCSKIKSDESLLPTANKNASTPSKGSLMKPTSHLTKKEMETTPSQEKDSSGEFKVAGIEFRYTIKDGKRFINDMPAEEFMKTLKPAQLLAIAHVAVIKSKLND